MGLFDFLKKNKSDVHSLDTDSSKSEKRTGAFKGDLACIQDRDVRKKRKSTIQVLRVKIEIVWIVKYIYHLHLYPLENGVVQSVGHAMMKT